MGAPCAPTAAGVSPVSRVMRIRSCAVTTEGRRRQDKSLTTSNLSRPRAGPCPWNPARCFGPPRNGLHGGPFPSRSERWRQHDVSPIADAGYRHWRTNTRSAGPDEMQRRSAGALDTERKPRRAACSVVQHHIPGSTFSRVVPISPARRRGHILVPDHQATRDLARHARQKQTRSHVVGSPTRSASRVR